MDPNICWPLAHNMIRRNSESNTFGMVRHRADGSVKPHQGWDFAAAIGTPCRAIADGTIADIRHDGDYGHRIVLGFTFQGRHLFAAYCHLSRIDVAEGQAVHRGQVIGLTGDSGNAKDMKGPDLHLHFEIRTIVQPGLGLDGRLTPRTVFDTVPLEAAIDG